MKEEGGETLGTRAETEEGTHTLRHDCYRRYQTPRDQCPLQEKVLARCSRYLDASICLDLPDGHWQTPQVLHKLYHPCRSSALKPAALTLSLLPGGVGVGGAASAVTPGVGCQVNSLG